MVGYVAQSKDDADDGEALLVASLNHQLATLQRAYDDLVATSAVQVVPYLCASPVLNLSRRTNFTFRSSRCFAPRS